MENKKEGGMSSSLALLAAMAFVFFVFYLVAGLTCLLRYDNSLDDLDCAYRWSAWLVLSTIFAWPVMWPWHAYVAWRDRRKQYVVIVDNNGNVHKRPKV